MSAGTPKAGRRKPAGKTQAVASPLDSVALANQDEERQRQMRALIALDHLSRSPEAGGQVRSLAGSLVEAGGMLPRRAVGALVEALSKGDEVVTQGGIAGRIAEVGDNFLHIEVAPNTNVVVQKQAVSTVLPKGTLKSL